MGLFTYTVAGGAFVLIGAWESLVSASETLTRQNPSPEPQSPPSPPQNIDAPTPETASFSSAITFVSISILSFLSVLNSLISLSDAISSKDKSGLALQLGVITICLLFLLYSLLGILSNTTQSFKFSSPLLNLIYAFAFGEEFLLFYTQNKDPSGIENRYYDLFLVPITICLFSTILELKSPKSNYPRLGRGIGLILQGTWILQMGFSFYSDLISNGCSLHEKSRGNYTIKCKGHPEYHRGRAIATLQFNCHLAFLVTLLVVVYSIFCKKNGINREFMRYKPLGNGGDMQLDGSTRFTLDSDEEENDDGDKIRDLRSVEMQKAIVVVSEPSVNGHGSHP